MNRAVNVKDVAREAGVSVATVSYVLNQKPTKTISPETTQRVLEAARKLGYVPNQAAITINSAKKQGVARSKLFGVVIPQTEPGREFMFSNPFYSEFLNAVEYTSRTNGYHLLISGTAAHQSYADIAINRSLDGIIAMGVYPSEYVADLRALRIPVVMVDCYINDHYFHNVGTNDRYGSFLATKYLIDRNHQTIAFVTGAVDRKGVNKARLAGYEDALAEAGLAFSDRLVIADSVGFEAGEEAAGVIAKMVPKVTAVHATADVIAVGLIKGLRRLGVRVPEDVSVIGFDDTSIAVICEPSLTTVRQNIAQKGSAAAELLIEMVGKFSAPKREVTIPLSLVERASVATRA
ncbi:MAG: LacI family transcriptional regulator [Clostridium sp.]|jgi:LacI family transcriptional regulator|nr:LacI family transcriptional regulator [Clostridium sp.]